MESWIPQIELPFCRACHFHLWYKFIDLLMIMWCARLLGHPLPFSSSESIFDFHVVPLKFFLNEPSSFYLRLFRILEFSGKSWSLFQDSRKPGNPQILFRPSNKRTRYVRSLVFMLILFTVFLEDRTYDISLFRVSILLCENSRFFFS